MIEAGKVRDDYRESNDFLRARKLRQVNQLNLFNNLTRGDENISTTMMLTLFNRIQSNLYDDKVQTKALPSREMTTRQVESLNKLYQHDYREVSKDQLDYDWCWNAMFFGDGFISTFNWNRETKTMRPYVFNNFAFGYDPYFAEPEKWRYYWHWRFFSKYELLSYIKRGVITGVTSLEGIRSGIEDELWDYKIRLDHAKLANAMPSNAAQSDLYMVLEMFCHDPETGEKHITWWDRDISTKLLDEKLDLRDGSNGESKWPIARKQVFRIPNSSISLSVPDIIDDKHRAKSVLLNLAYLAAKDEANPLMQYNPALVRDVSQLYNRTIAQHIPVDDVQAAIAPLARQGSLSTGLMAFLQLLDSESNNPIGTGMALTSGKKGKQSATETAVQQQLNDLAQSLQSKILQFGEKEYFAQWYHRYMRFTTPADEKMVSVTNARGMTFESMKLGDIRSKYPPGCDVSSAKEAEYKELVLRRDLQSLYPQLAQTLDPAALRNFNKFVFFPKFLNDSTMVDLIVPKTLDELKAEEENDILNENKFVPVKMSDDHETHLFIHDLAKPTNAKWAHRIAHEEMLALKMKQEKEQAQQAAQQQSQGGGQPQMPKGKQLSSKKKNPAEAATPLTQELSTSNAMTPKPMAQ